MTLQFIIAMIASAINDRRQRKLDYLEEERGIPAQSPNCNPHAERFVETIEYECLNHLVLFGERHLRHVIEEFMAHYHRERFHQGLGGRLVERQAVATNGKGACDKVTCRSRLGGMQNYYHREAA